MASRGTDRGSIGGEVAKAAADTTSPTKSETVVTLTASSTLPIGLRPR